MIPHCHLQAELQLIGPHQRESLRHTVYLLGAKEPYNKINICISVQGIARWGIFECYVNLILHYQISHKLLSSCNIMIKQVNNT